MEQNKIILICLFANIMQQKNVFWASVRHTGYSHTVWQLPKNDFKTQCHSWGMGHNKLSMLTVKGYWPPDLSEHCAN